MATLFHVPLSPFCRKVRLSLAEKKIECQLIEERYWEQDMDFLRRNPAGKVLKRELRKQFAADTGWQNLAEFAIGLNDKAKVTGIVLEDEKAGFHWAFGRSDHLGGVVGVEDFESPESVVHQDIVYAEGNPVQVEQAVIVHPDGRRVAVIDEGEYKI